MENSNPNVGETNSASNMNQPQNVPVQETNAPEANTETPVQAAPSQPQVEPSAPVQETATFAPDPNVSEQPQAAEPSVSTGAAPVKSSKLKMIIIAAIVVILAVGGYFVYQYMTSNNSSDDTIEFIEE